MPEQAMKSAARRVGGRRLGMLVYADRRQVIAPAEARLEVDVNVKHNEVGACTRGNGDERIRPASPPGADRRLVGGGIEQAVVGQRPLVHATGMNGTATRRVAQRRLKKGGHCIVSRGRAQGLPIPPNSPS